MSAEPTAGGTTDPGGSVPTGQAPPPSGQEPGGEAAMTLEQALAALERTRREHAGTRSRLTTLERQQQEADAAKLSDLEKAQRERDTIKAELEAERLERREAINRYEVQIAASRLGIVDPDAAAKLLDWDTLEYAEDGSPRGVEKALQALIKARPWLAGQQAQPPGPQANPANPARRNGNPGLTIEDVKRMSPNEVTRRWAEVSKVLAGTQ